MAESGELRGRFLYESQIQELLGSDFELRKIRKFLGATDFAEIEKATSDLRSSLLSASSESDKQSICKQWCQRNLF